MKSGLKRIFVFLLASAVLISSLNFSVLSVKADTSYTFNIEVQYSQSDARAMLDYINKFRAGEDEDGQAADYWNSDNTEKVKCEELEPLIYDYSLERTAMLRAAEIALSFDHTRPDGTSCFTAWDENIYWSTQGENIAAGSSTTKAAFTQWREDDKNYSGQGHRRNMLSSNYTRVGIGHVVFNGVHYWVQDFGRGTGDDNAVAPNDEMANVSIEVSESRIQSISYQKPKDSITLTEGLSSILPEVTMTFLLAEAFPAEDTSVVINTEWIVDDPETAYIENGVLIAVKTGTTQITAEVNGTVISIPVTVLEPVAINASLSIDSETVESGTAPANRPKTAVVSWNNQTTTTETIAWDKAIEKDDYTIREGGTTVYHGTVQGLDVTYTVTVEKAAIAGADDLPAIDIYTTTDNIASYLPKTVHVYWSDGDPATDEEVQWSDVPDQFTEVGSKTVEGTVNGTYKVTQTFNVKEPLLTGIEWKTAPKNTAYVLGDALQADGVITAIYDSGDTADIPVTDDMVTGFDSSKVGTVTLTVYYEGKTLSYEIVIAAAKLDSMSIEYDKTDYDGTEKKPSVTVYAKVNGTSKELTGGTDYTITYTNNTNAGTATATITGTGNYTGSLEVDFTITKVSLKSADLAASSYSYNGSAIKPAVTVKAVVGGSTKTLTNGTDYTVTYKNNTNAGTAAVTIKGAGNYSGTIEKTFKITTVSLKSVKLKATSFAYTGKKIKPAVIVKAMVNGVTKTLKKGTDYKVTYSSNKKAGKAKVVVKGIGNYSGKITKTFKITRVKLSSATLKKTSYTCDGKAKKPAVTVKAKVNGKTKTLKKGTDYKVVYSNNKSAGTATVKITGIGNYKGTIKKSFTIKAVQTAAAAATAVTAVSETTAVSSSGSYIGNKNSMIFHKDSCGSVKLMNESNKVYFNESRDNIIAMGYTPCQRCNP